MSDTFYLDPEESKRQSRIDQLRREGVVGEMIANALSVQEMSPDELISCLISDAYGLAPTEANLKEVMRIIRKHDKLLRIDFKRSLGCFTVRTVLSI